MKSRLSQFLCKHGFTSIAENEISQEALYRCRKCGLYEMYHYGIGSQRRTRNIDINEWNFNSDYEKKRAEDVSKLLKNKTKNKGVL